MKTASRGLSLAAVIVAAVNLVASLTHFLVAQSSQWMAIGQLIFAVGLFPLALVLRCALRKETHFRWNGLICMGVLAALFFTGDTVAEILLKNKVSATVENLPWVDMIMVNSFLCTIAAGGLTFTAAFLDAIHSLGCSRDTKDPLRLSTKVFWTDIIVGALWCLASISGFVHKNIVTFLVSIFSLVGALIIVAVMHRIRSEQFDEMAEANYRHAKAKTLDITGCIILGSCAIFIILDRFLSNISPNLNPYAVFSSDNIYKIVWFVLGLQSIIKGLIFRKLEAE